VFNMVEGYNDVLRYEHLVRDLTSRWWSTTRIEKVMCGNFMRLFGELWPAEG